MSYERLGPGRDSHIELVARRDGTLAINRGHDQPLLVEKAIAGIDHGIAIEYPPSLFVKVAHLESSSRRQAAATAPATPHNAAIRATYDPFNELRMAAHVKEVVHSPAAQAIANRYSFDRIRFVEPLLTHADETMGLATTIYPWQTGITAVDRLTGRLQISADELLDLDNVCTQLTRLFMGRGIVAADLKPNQFILSAPPGGYLFTVLNLVDTHLYHWL